MSSGFPTTTTPKEDAERMRTIHARPSRKSWLQTCLERLARLKRSSPSPASLSAAAIPASTLSIPASSREASAHPSGLPPTPKKRPATAPSTPSAASASASIPQKQKAKTALSRRISAPPGPPPPVPEKEPSTTHSPTSISTSAAKKQKPISAPSHEVTVPPPAPPPSIPEKKLTTVAPNRSVTSSSTLRRQKPIPALSRKASPPLAPPLSIPEKRHTTAEPTRSVASISTSMPQKQEQIRALPRQVSHLLVPPGPSIPKTKLTTAVPTMPNATSTSTPMPKQKPTPASPHKAAATQASPASVPKKRSTIATPAAHIDLPSWEHETITQVFKITLEKDVAENSGWDLVWLNKVATQLTSENPALQKPIRLIVEKVNRLLIGRLELVAQATSDDLEYLPVLASLPPQQTVFEFLVGCWKRSNAVRSAILKKGYPPAQVQQATTVLDKLRDLIMAYIGMTLRDPKMFPQPAGRDVGPSELIPPLLSLSPLCAPILTVPKSSQTALGTTNIGPFLEDIVRRFEFDNELDKVLGPVVCALLFHESLTRPEGLGGSDPTWRGIIGGLEALAKIKPIAAMITRLPEWNPPLATAASIEKTSLMGPLCRLNVFGREWPSIAKTYFSEVDEQRGAKVESSTAGLRAALQSLQSSLFRIFDLFIRASPESREAVLQYFARVITLNVKRAETQTKPETIATDSFILNLQIVLYRLAEPFMDASHSKIDRIDPLYFTHSFRLLMKNETRIKATSEGANAPNDTTPPHFISDIFYLTLAINHYGYQQTIRDMDDFARHEDEIQRRVDKLRGDATWVKAPLHPRTEAAIQSAKVELEKIRSHRCSSAVQLLDPEMIFRSMAFANLLCTWLGRLVDPKKTHPNPVVDLPLPRGIPMAFRVLPEFILEDMVNYFLFVVRRSPSSLELSGKNELVIFSLTFLTSTWYIKNPSLKVNIVEVLFNGLLGYGRERTGVLNNVLNTHPVALKHLMPALMNFYVDVDRTGANSSVYDKFSSKRNVPHIFKAIWDNQAHREALSVEATGVDRFARFINLMVDDATYLMNESLSELTQIYNIQTEMEDREGWESQTTQYRRECEASLRKLERHVSWYTALGQSVTDLLKIFTAETKAPFVMPGIVSRLAAMLNLNLDALVGPKCRELGVKNPEKYKFNPRQLLSDILQVFLNLSEEQDFIRAVAGDPGRNPKVLFEKAFAIATKRALKTDAEIAKLAVFVERVEAKRLETLEADDDIGEIMAAPTRAR